LWILGELGQSVGGPVGKIFSHLSLFQNFNDLSQGVLDSSGLILFASYIVLGIFLTAQSIDALRFQRS
jgi:ABC-2 type transport system permease protein